MTDLIAQVKMPRAFRSQQLTPEQLQALSEYKNRGEDRSLTYKYLLSPLYSRLVQFLPLWLAPNAVTLIGLFPTITAHTLLMYYSHDFQSSAPSWVYLYAGLSLFFYMVMDNLDGKQARRTASSSPLGHLFDHGCDTLNVTLSGINMLATVQLPPGLMSISVLYALGQLSAFFATLEEYFTGAMILREFNGPNEGILILCTLQIATSVAGPQLWTRLASVPFIGISIQLNNVIYYSALFPALVTILGNMTAILQHLQAQGLAPTHALRTLASHSLPIVLFGMSVNGWAWLARENFARQAARIMWLSGLVLFDLVSRIILATLTRAPFPFFPVLLVVLILCATNAVVETVFGIVPLDSVLLTYSTLVGTSVYCAWRVQNLITQICEYLNIKCFALGKLRIEQVGKRPH